MDLRPYSTFSPPGAVARGDFRLDIDEQWKVELVLLAELLVRCSVVGRDAEYDRALGLDVRHVVAQRASLFRASRRVVARVEVQHDGLSGVVGQLVDVCRPGRQARNLAPDRLWRG